jgi:hypothetical protein
VLDTSVVAPYVQTFFFLSHILSDSLSVVNNKTET